MLAMVIGGFKIVERKARKLRDHTTFRQSFPLSWSDQVVCNAVHDNTNLKKSDGNAFVKHVTDISNRLYDYETKHSSCQLQRASTDCSLASCCCGRPISSAFP